MARVRHLLAITAAAGLLAQVGCLQAYNPTYFPNWGYGGPIDRTHAKPSGGAYFKNYDPKACKIELTPLRCDNPVGKQQVLIASVVDADGMPRRSRRVEWIIDGPGFIVEVDESGWYSARGYKVDNKYAVSHTDYKEHTITRGNDDPRDDFTIAPGQTWCVVSSAVEGQTTVTAYAPEVFSWESGRVTSVLTWGPPLPPGGGGEFYPPPVVSRTGTTALATSLSSGSKTADLTLNVKAPKAAGLDREVPITVVMANAGKADGQPVTVRTTVPDGAEFVRSDPPPTSQQGRSLSWKLDAIPGGQSKPVALTIRPTRRCTLEMTATAETADGLKAEQKASMTVDTAGLIVAVESPKQAEIGERVSLAVAVTNTGSVPVIGATAWLTLDPGLIPETGSDQTELPVGTVGPGQSKRVEVRVSAKKSGRYAVRANVTADGGLTARADGAVEVRRTELSAAITGPKQVNVGQDGTWEIRLTNAGETSLTGLTVRAALPQGITPSGKTEWPVDSLAAGESKSVKLTATGDAIADGGSIRVTATTATGTKTTAEAAVAVVGRPALTVEMPNPPGVVPVGRRGPVRVTVRNTGDAPARRVEVKLTGSAELTMYGGTGPAPDRATATLDGNKVAFPALDSLPPGASAVFTAEVGATTPGSARLSAEVLADHLSQPVRDEQSARVVP